MKNTIKRNLDDTAVRNYLAKYEFLMYEYQKIKNRTHTKFRKVKDFYETHGLERRNFLKYYNRWVQNGFKKETLLPQKRGPRYKTRRIPGFIEGKIIELRRKGFNRYEIVEELKPRFKKFTPSASTVYNVFRRNKMNIKDKKMKEKKRRIVKREAGELGHIDIHYLSRGIIKGKNKRLYMLGVLDDKTRITWLEVLEGATSLEAMFGTLNCLHILRGEYGIQFKEVLTDNGREFGGREIKEKRKHPFERLLIELEVKHRYTRPYRPQTNGKIERFWKTMEEELLEGVTFKDIEDMREEVMRYAIYYNHMRPHMGLGGKKPVDLLPNYLTSTIPRRRESISKFVRN